MHFTVPSVPRLQRAPPGGGRHCLVERERLDALGQARERSLVRLRVILRRCAPAGDATVFQARAGQVTTDRDLDGIVHVRHEHRHRGVVGLDPTEQVAIVAAPARDVAVGQACARVSVGDRELDCVRDPDDG